MRKQVIVKCAFCNIDVQKAESEVKRNLKLGRNNFCSRTCLGKHNTTNLPNKEGFELNTSSDKYTHIRLHLKRSKQRKKFDNDLDLEYLRKLWDKQKGLCVYSKVKLNKAHNEKRNNPIYTASLDRIDSSKGYVKGNVQFISICMNNMKNVMSDIEMKRMLDILKGQQIA